MCISNGSQSAKNETNINKINNGAKMNRNAKKLPLLIHLTVGSNRKEANDGSSIQKTSTDSIFWLKKIPGKNKAKASKKGIRQPE